MKLIDVVCMYVKIEAFNWKFAWNKTKTKKHSVPNNERKFKVRFEISIVLYLTNTKLEG